MGFGGVSGMITSLKNNDRRHKREAFDRWTTTDKKSKGIVVKPITEKALQDIQQKLKKQQKNAFYKNVIALSLLLPMN